MEKRLRKIWVFSVVFLLVFMPVIFALDTNVKVKTKADRLVTVRFGDDSGTLENGAFIDQPVNDDGEVSVSYSSDYVNYVKISVLLRDSVGGLIKFSDGSSLAKFNDVKTGWNYVIDLTVSPAVILKGESTGTVSEPVVEEAPEVVEEIVEPVVEEEVIENQALTGQAIDGESSIDIKKMIYIGVGLFLVIVIILIFIKKKNSKPTNSTVKIRDKSNDEKLLEDQEIEDAERKIKEAEDEIKDIKKKRKELDDAEKKFEEDKKKLEMLKRQSQ